MLKYAAVILSSILSLLAMPGVAIPCGNAVLLQGDDATKQVKKAEKYLARGENRQAMKLADIHEFEFADNSLSQRAFLVYQVAAMRLDSSPESSISMLKDLHEGKADDPYLAARLAEALTRRADFKPKRDWQDKALDAGAAKKMRGQAMTILADLEKRDLMPDAMAYATLATLHKHAGDGKARAAALKKCRKMTKYGGLCRVF